jgi:hypothetical protein
MKLWLKIVAASVALMICGGCIIDLAPDLVVVTAPADMAINVPLQPTFRWKILDPAIVTDGHLKCQLYEKENYESERRTYIWMAVGLQEDKQTTYPVDPSGQVGFGVNDKEARLKPKTKYVAVFTYSMLGTANFKPVVVEFTTSEH